MPTHAPDLGNVTAEERARIHRAVGISIIACRQCGATFLALRTDARYCSSACRQAAYRARKRRTPVPLRS